MTAKGVRCAYACPCGWAFDGEAKPGRLTVRGTCPQCSKAYTARRVASDAPRPPELPIPGPTAPRGGRTVRKVPGYDTSGIEERRRAGSTPRLPTREAQRIARARARGDEQLEQLGDDGGTGDSGTRPDEPGGREPVDELRPAPELRHGPARELEPELVEGVY